MRLGAAAAIIAIVIFISFVLSVPHTQDGNVEAPSQKVAVIPGVTLRDSYRGGVHTITGSLLLPNACTTPAAQAFLSGEASTTQSIVVAITFETDTGVCLQVPTRAAFEAKLTAPSGLPITATVNGSIASTTRS